MNSIEDAASYLARDGDEHKLLPWPDMEVVGGYSEFGLWVLWLSSLLRLNLKFAP